MPNKQSSLDILGCLRQTAVYRLSAKLRYYLLRSFLEKLILKTKPFAGGYSDDCQCEVRIAVSDFYANMAIWALKSFYYYSQVRWPLIIHPAGKISSRTNSLLKSHFPDCLILDYESISKDVNHHLHSKGYEDIIEARNNSFLFARLVDAVILSKRNNVLMLDADVLFFSHPFELIKVGESRLAKSVYIRDCASVYDITPGIIKERYGFDILERVNAGLGILYRPSLDLGLLNRFAGDPDMRGLSWGIDQTILAMCLSIVGCDFLPDEYNVNSWRGLKTPSGSDIVAKHYAGTVKPNYYIEGIPVLKHNGFLKAIS